MTTRHLPFERGVNFRDLGGYETADGARVKWRRLFRCGAMDRLTDADVARLAELRLVSVCDFRRPEECAEQPSRLPDDLRAKVRQLTIGPKPTGTRADEAVGALMTGKRHVGELSAEVHAVYREMAIDFAPVYARMFRHLVEAEGQPMLIHCVGGKDRTGIGSALILSALGVPEQTIVDDYMLSTESVPLRIWLNGLIDKAAARHALTRPREQVFADVMAVWGVAPDWLHAALRAMDETSGSVEGYIREVLGVTAAELKYLRGWYLET